MVITSTITMEPNKVATTKRIGKISTPVKKVCKITLRESVLKLRLSENMEAMARQNKATCWPTGRCNKNMPSLWKSHPTAVSLSSDLAISCAICLVYQFFTIHRVQNLLPNAIQASLLECTYAKWLGVQAQALLNQL